MTIRGLLPSRRDGVAGATAVEFTIVSSALVLTLIAMLEIGWQLAVAGALEFGVREAAQLCATGGSCSRESFADEIARRGAILDRVRLTVSAQTFVGETWPGSADRCRFDLSSELPPMRGSDIVRFCVSYSQPWMTRLDRLWSVNDGVQHRVVALVRNEPF